MDSFEGEKKEGELPIGQITEDCRSQIERTTTDEVERPVYEKSL